MINTDITYFLDAELRRSNVVLKERKKGEKKKKKKIKLKAWPKNETFRGSAVWKMTRLDIYKKRRVEKN